MAGDTGNSPESFKVRIAGTVDVLDVAAGKDIDDQDKEAHGDAWQAEGIKLCIEQIQEVREIEGAGLLNP